MFLWIDFNEINVVNIIIINEQHYYNISQVLKGFNNITLKKRDIFLLSILLQYFAIILQVNGKHHFVHTNAPL